MTNKERKLVLHCLKANSDFHKEVCEECSRYPECDHFVQDGVMEKLIEELEREPCEDAISREVLLNRLANIAKANAKSDAQKALMGRVIFFTEHLPPVQPKLIECEDAISRKAILECQYTINENETLGISTKNVVNVDDILNAKPVQPKSKTGHWIFDEILDRNYYCSECKSMGVDYWDYCPYCGCRMVEPQESEET